MAGTETKDFLENRYGSYVELRSPYALDKGMISAYLEAKAEDDLIERRSIKLAVAVEMLKSIVIENTGLGIREFIIDPVVFEGFLSQLKASMKAIVGRGKSRCIADLLQDAILSDGKLKELNRRSFNWILRKLRKQIGFNVDEAELKLFIACRNSLLHRGRFYCMTHRLGRQEELHSLAFCAR